MSSASPVSLCDCFAEIADTADKDPIEHVLALTYEFDDQQLLNLLAGRRLDENFEPRPFDLKRISQLAPVVIYDARKTREFNLVPHFMELLPCRMDAYQCHHPKAYLVVAREYIHLFLGSMNLTRTGLFSNREVFCDWHWRARDMDNLSVLWDFIALLEQGYSDKQSAPLTAIIQAVRMRLASWQNGMAAAPKPTSHLISSGYDKSKSGLEALAELWESLMGQEPPDKVFAVSPFFDKGTQGKVFAEDLVARFSAQSEPAENTLDTMHIVTDRACLPTLARGHFSGVHHILQVIDTEIDEVEQRRIAQANDLSSVASLKLRRSLHAKILVLGRGKRCLVYIGSANFTRKAWNGDNRELGVAWCEPNTQKLINGILSSLHVQPQNLVDSLPDNLSETDLIHEDDYSELIGFPDFVDSIQLKETGDQGLFRFEVSGSCLERLAAYDIDWGSRRLRFEGAQCAPLRGDILFASLLGGRNLRFSPKENSDRFYYLPFRHAPELFEQRELHQSSSAEDWMRFHLGMESAVNRSLDDRLPGEEDLAQQQTNSSLFEAGRETNAMVRMQCQLSLFGRLENEFRGRAMALMNDAPTERPARWHAIVAAPLKTFATLIGREPAQTLEQRMARDFRLGELTLFVRGLHGDKELTHTLAQSIAAMLPTSSADPAVQHYLDFCHGH